MNIRQLFLQNIAQTSPTPLMLEIVKAKGVYLYNAENDSYIDMISGISVSNVGHCHPAVVKAIQEQSERFMHLMVYGEYVYEPQVMLAKELHEVLPDSLDNFYFTNSGTEAVEGALKLAKRYTGKSEIVSCHNAYHGSTAGSLSAMGSEEYKMAYRPLIPNHSLIEYGDYSDLDKITEHTAAVLIEVIQAEAGVKIAPKKYFELLKAKCEAMNCLLIFDEIQTGIGRTGTLFAFEQYDVIPDILLIGKGFGGGMPIAAFIANKKKMNVLSHHPILGHLSTFGGNPVCCEAARATLQVVLDKKVLNEVEPKGKYLEDKLIELGCETIRRKGLMFAIEFNSQKENFALIERCLQQKIITDWFLFNDKSMRICPPLTISYTEIDDFINRLQKALNTIS